MTQMSMTYLLGASFAILLTGCGGSSSTGSPPTPLSVSAQTSEGLTATLAEQSAVVSTSSNPAYTMTLTNATSASISYQGKAYDSNNVQTPFARLTVYSADGSVFYPGGEAAVVPPPSHAVTITLQPGQSQSEAASPGSSPAGQYDATASFVTSGVTTVTPHLPLKVQ